MKLIEAKCPKCKKLITVDGDSDSTKCDFCGEKIDVKDALLEKMMSSKKINIKKSENKKVEEVEEDFGEEKSNEVEQPVKVKKTTNKVLKPKKNDKFISYILRAEELLNAKEYDDALENYNLAIEEDPNDKYCLFKIYFTYVRKNRLDRENLMKSYEILKDLDYYIDENGEINKDVDTVIGEFIEFIYRQATQIHYSIKGRTGTSLDKVKAYFNILYAYLYVFENFTNEDISQELKERIIIYILGIIDILSETYYCGSKGKTKFRDNGNISLLQDKKENYTNQLIVIDPSYKESIKKENDVIDKKNKQIRKEANKNKRIDDRFFDFIVEHQKLSWIIALAILLLWWFIKGFLSSQ